MTGEETKRREADAWYSIKPQRPTLALSQGYHCCQEKPLAKEDAV